VSNVFRHRGRTGKSYCRTRSDVGSERVNGRGGSLTCRLTSVMSCPPARTRLPCYMSAGHRFSVFVWRCLVMGVGVIGRLYLKCDGRCAKTRFRLTAFEMLRHMRRKQISSYCFCIVAAHEQKPDFVLLRLKCDGTCAETRFRLTAFEMWWHMGRNQIRLTAFEMWRHMRRNRISSYCVWNVTAHAQKPDLVFWRNGPVHLNGRGNNFSRLLAGELCTSACSVYTARASLYSAVMWHLLATQSIRQFPLHFSRASLCDITFQKQSTFNVQVHFFAKRKNTLKNERLF
jgi:hypothetical protein